MKTTAPDSAPLTSDRKDLTGITFISPNHSNQVTWTVEGYHRGGNWVCRESGYQTTMHFHESDILAFSAPSPSVVPVEVPSHTLANAVRMGIIHCAWQCQRGHAQDHRIEKALSVRGQMLDALHAAGLTMEESEVEKSPHAANLAKIKALEDALGDALFLISEHADHLASQAHPDEINGICDAGSAALALPSAPPSLGS